MIVHEGQAAVSDARPSLFFDILEKGFQEACERMGPCHVDLEIGDLCVRLQFAGTSMRDLFMPALAHARKKDTGVQDPDLRIQVWDSASTGVAGPPPAWSHDDYRERGLIRGFNTDRFRTCFQIGPDTLSMLDLDCNVGIQWVRDAGALPYYEKGAPLRHLFNWWMSEHGYMLVHAAAVATSERAALLVGRGGSGKSTSAISCLGTDLQYISDDYCLVGPADAPAVHSLYSTAKLTHDSLNQFPALAARIEGATLVADDKLLFFLHPMLEESMTTGTPLDTIFVPRIDPSTSSSVIEPISKAHALLALAPSSIFQLSGAGGQEFGILSALVERTKCRRVRLGSDVSSFPAIAYEYLTGVGN